FLVAQATRLCRPATRRTEWEQRFEPIGTRFPQDCSSQFRSAGRRPERASRPRYLFLPPHQSADELHGGGVIGKHHGQLLRAHDPITLAPGHDLYRTTARTVDEGKLVVDSTGPYRIEQSGPSFHEGIHDP